MPWSEWQSGPTAIRSFSKYTVASLTFGGTFFNGWRTSPTGLLELYAAIKDANAVNPYGSIETKESAVYYVVSNVWKTDRDWFPVTLLGLEEGVDYGLRPDRTEFDDDAYVQYESDGDNTVTEEFKPLLRYQAGGTGGGTGGSPGDGVWALGYTANPTLPIQTSSGAEFSVESWPAPATVFATGAVEAVNTSHSAQFPDGFSAASTIRVSVNMPGIPPLLSEDPGGDGSLETAAAQFTIGSPSFRYQMPRWRYWIPKRLPLQQKQRRDGLALRGAPAWRRKASRQATNQWRANL
jgi:hypothetical protein